MGPLLPPLRQAEGPGRVTESGPVPVGRRAGAVLGAVLGPPGRASLCPASEPRYLLVVR